MIRNIRIYESMGFDPHYNIAIEKFLLEHVEPDTCVLYLWQNQNTVVIGRNQNAWVECRTTLLEQEGGKLARRLSGGGAVFHDLGNLNFTFLMQDADYDLDRQLDVILAACHALGIPAEKSGRNDLLSDGKKFSGNAFYHSQGRAYHHGTLLVNADMEKLSRYLTPSKAKLQAKGVSSVRSRVTNLSELCPGLDCEQLRRQLKVAFGQVYGLKPEHVTLTSQDLQEIEENARSLGSWQWCYGPRQPFSFSCEDRFDWGSIELQLQMECGIIKNVKVFSDAMDWTLSDAVSRALTGCSFTLADMTQTLVRELGQSQPCQDICTLLTQQQI